MKKGALALLIGLIILLGSVVVVQQKEIKESNRLVLDLQDTIRMMEDEVNQAYNKLDEVINEKQLGHCY